MFVTGGTGLIGRALVRRLVDRGDVVAVLTRNAAAANGRLPAGVSLVEGDPSAPGGWQELVSDAEAVVNLAGEPIFARRWSRAQKEKIRSSRVRSTENVAEAMTRAAAAAARTLISGSAIGYYGARGEEELCEDAPAGSDFLARVGIEWEGAARPASEAGIRVVLVRTGIVLAREGGALRQMALPFRLHMGGPVGNGRQWVSWIHIEDLVGILIHALDNESVEGPINATAPGPVTNRELSRALGEVLGRKSWLPAPGFMLRLVLGEVAGLVTTGQRVLPGRPLASGYRFGHPELSEALEDILAPS